MMKNLNTESFRHRAANQMLRLATAGGVSQAQISPRERLSGGSGNPRMAMVQALDVRAQVTPLLRQ